MNPLQPTDSPDASIITAVTRQINDANRVSVFVNSKYLFSLTVDQLLEARLKKGMQLTQEQIVEFVQLSSDGKLRSRALEWVMSRPRSRRELNDYLKRKGASQELIERISDEFVEKKYIDDERFARWLYDVRLRKNKSSRAIHAELLAKGVNQEILRMLDNEQHKNDSDRNALGALIQKVRSRPRYADQKKLIAYLLSKGFSYSDVKDALNSEDN